MPLKRFLQNRKGISEVIGSLVLILIVTVAGVGVYAYSLNAMSSSSSNLNQRTNQLSQQSQERFEIIRAWSNDQQMNITVLNYGQTDLHIVAVYVNGTPAQQYMSGVDKTVGTDQLLTVEFTSPVQVTAGSNLEILAVSERGGKTTVLYEP